MLPYTLFFCYVTLCFLFHDRTPGGLRGLVTSTIFLYMLLFSGLRGVVGADTPTYLGYFERADSLDGWELLFQSVEPLFAIFILMVRVISEEGAFFLFSCSLLQTFIAFYIYKKTANKNFIFVYLILFYLNFHFNTLRAGLATLLFLAALLSSKRSIRYAFLVAAPGFHVSILIFYPILFYTQESLKRVAVFVALAILFFLGASSFGLIDFAVGKIIYYDGYLSDVSSASIFNISIYAGYFLMAAYIMRLESPACSRVSVALAFFYLTILFMPIFYRFVIIGHAIYFLLITEALPVGVLTRKAIFLLWLPLVALSALSVYGVYNETNLLVRRVNIGELPASVLDSTYVPYKLFLSD